MKTCTKRYSDIPFAHRQPNHEGHCRFVHGHNWDILVTFSAEVLDSNNFVVDFGGLKYLKRWIDENLDHACVLCCADPLKSAFEETGAFKVTYVPDASCEGLAEYIYSVFKALVNEKEAGRVSVIKIELHEDSKNSAAFSA